MKKLTVVFLVIMFCAVVTGAAFADSQLVPITGKNGVTQVVKFERMKVPVAATKTKPKKAKSPGYLVLKDGKGKCRIIKVSDGISIVLAGPLDSLAKAIEKKSEFCPKATKKVNKKALGKKALKKKPVLPPAIPINPPTPAR